MARGNLFKLNLNQNFNRQISWLAIEYETKLDLNRAFRDDYCFFSPNSVAAPELSSKTQPYLVHE